MPRAHLEALATQEQATNDRSDRLVDRVGRDRLDLVWVWAILSTIGWTRECGGAARAPRGQSDVSFLWSALDDRSGCSALALPMAGLAVLVWMALSSAV